MNFIRLHVLARYNRVNADKIVSVILSSSLFLCVHSGTAYFVKLQKTMPEIPIKCQTNLICPTQHSVIDRLSAWYNLGPVTPFLFRTEMYQ
jgi:hypothetical protein